jgi:hypothetical protein
MSNLTNLCAERTTTSNPVPEPVGSVREIIGDTWDALEKSVMLLEGLAERLMGMRLAPAPDRPEVINLRNAALRCAELADYTRAALRDLRDTTGA